MLASANMWGVFIALAITLPICLLVCVVAILIYYDSRQMEVEFHILPRLIPWTTRSRVRKARAEADLAQAQQDLATIQHSRLQKQMILHDLEEVNYKKALEVGHED